MPFRVCVALGCMLALAAAAGMLSLTGSPSRLTSLAGWAAVLAGAAPVVLGLEWLGTAILENRRVTRMPAVWRIVYGVLAILLLGGTIWSIWAGAMILLKPQ